MAVIIPATGSGTTTPTVATENVGGAHYQQVKLIDGTAASTTVIASGGGVESGALRVTIASDSTGLLSVDDNGSSLTVDGTVGISGTVDTELPAAVALADNAGNPTAPAVGAFGLVWDGATWDRAPGNSTDGTLVNLGTNNDVTVTGTVTANAGTNLNTSALALETTLGTRLADATLTGRLPAGASPADNESNTNTNLSRIGAFNFVFDGTAWDRAPGTTADGTLVNLGANNDVTVTSGTITLGTGSANIGDVDVLTVPAPLSTTGGGAEATALRVTVANDSTGVLSVDDNGGALTVDNGGTFAVQAAQSGTWTVQPGDTANTTAWLVSERPAASGGQTIFRRISTADTNAASVKASAGQVYGWYITNVNASPRYAKLYNKASAPTVGSDTPVMTLLIPGNTAGAGSTLGLPCGAAFSTGIALAITTGVADADTGAVAANEIVVHLFYT